MTDSVLERLRRADPFPADGREADRWPRAAVDLLTAEARPVSPQPRRRRRRRAAAVGGVALAGAAAATALGAAVLMSGTQAPGNHAAGLENVMVHYGAAFGVETMPPGAMFVARPSHAPDLATGTDEDGFARWALWLIGDGGPGEDEGLWAATPSTHAAARADCPAPDEGTPVRACLHEPEGATWPEAFGMPRPEYAATERYIAGRVAPGVMQIDVVDSDGVEHAALVGNGLFLAADLPAAAVRLVATDAAGASTAVEIAAAPVP